MKKYGGVDVKIRIFLTSAEIGVKLHVPASLLPGKEPPVLIGYEAGWAQESVWPTWRRDNPWAYRDSNSDPP
jgi:hypothetical protein